MSESTDIERQMREALGIAPRKKKHTFEASNPMRGYHIVLSVRAAVGPAYRFEYRSRSLSKTEAILGAEKAARSQGLRPWALLDATEA